MTLASAEHQIQRGKEWFESFFKLADLSLDVTVQLSETSASDEDGQNSDTVDSGYGGLLTLGSPDLTSQQVETLIGPQGSVIDSLQYLVNLVINLNQSPSEQLPFTVDLNGYRSKRSAELQDLADMAVVKARETHEEIELKSLSSAERRQVHTMLKEFADIETYSRGREPDRRLVVRLKSAI